jgi:hypothetical protein
MYEEAQPELDRIVTLVKSCPEEFQVKGFELLLHGYVESQLHRRPIGTAKETPNGKGNGDGPPPDESDADGTDDVVVPAAIGPRFKILATRSNVTQKQLEDLFDFNVDPFTFASVTIEGKNYYEKARKVALLVGAKNYLNSGKWVANWEEIKALCMDNSCYDAGNFAKAMREATGTLFKTVVVPTYVELNNFGTTKAHELVGELAGNAANQ